MSKIELLKAVKISRIHLLQTIEGSSPEEIIKPEVIGSWSVRDTLSHIAGWDVWMSNALRAVVEGNPIDRSMTLDFNKTNTVFINERNNMPLEQILTEMDITHKKMLCFVKNLSEEQIKKPHIIDGYNWSVETFLKIWVEHDPHHTKMLLQWKKSLKEDKANTSNNN